MIEGAVLQSDSGESRTAICAISLGPQGDRRQGDVLNTHIPTGALEPDQQHRPDSHSNNQSHAAKRVQVALGVAPADGQASEMTPPLSELVSLLLAIQAGILHLLAVFEQSDFAVP
ncbi:hypothetical protein Q8A67_011763 [Cirrhinus molitorella]|uniref:Uncharacterized protein n=1 Tax=Cirrhinus molitorella TaxID=172907 RepID=A0AA88PL58_9TELE|nr:hypothetical protein Q8A67_011763 [Cirrhinus molitorella]